MTTAPASPPPSTGAPPRSAGPGSSPSGPMAAPSIDPIRLLQRYKVLLIASMMVGVIAGVAAWQVWLRVAPTYTSFALFEISPPKTEAGERQEGMDLDEIERYMNTQAAIMTGERVLQAVVELPTIREDVRTWAEQFVENGQFATAEARRALQDAISARPNPDTLLIQLTAKATTSGDAYTLVKLVREEYLNQLSQVELRKLTKEQDALRRQIDALKGEVEDNDPDRLSITELQDKRESILIEEGIDSLDGRTNEASMALAGVTEQLNQVRLDMQSVKEQLERLEASRDKPNGPLFSDDLRAEVEQHPIIVNLKQQIAQAETSLRAIEASGTGRRNLTYRRLKSQLESLRVQLEDQMQRELERTFFGRIESMKNVLNSLKGQEKDLLERKAELKERLNKFTIAQAEIEDIELEIEDVRNRIAELEAKLGNLEAIEAQATAEAGNRDVFGREQFLDRVDVVQYEEVPDKVSWPDPIIVVPAATMLVVAMTGGLVVLRELLDQRVKGPADVALIPRTRVLGMIPLSTEDPGKLKSVETAFRDQPQGALAEQFRSVRTLLAKRMHQNNYRSLMITSGFPESGTTTTAVNLACACAASEMRVLLVDANLRRPALHRLLGLSSEPGLVDVMAGVSTLAESVQNGAPGLDVLVAGSVEERVFERLACPAMDRLLNAAMDEYDVILIDTAPMVVSGDALALANKCDANMLVIRALSEKRGLVARLRNQLADARGELLGVLVNGVRASAGGYLRRNMRATHEYQREPGDNGRVGRR